jgi:protein-S-isoprenylcysteine O-methyltransferase Ste14
MSPAVVYRALFAALLVSYVVFVVIVFKRPAGAAVGRVASRRPVRIGVILQSASYMFAWALRRPRVYPFGNGSIASDILIALASLAFACGAIALAVAAKKRLGRQWSLAARVIDGHRLVEEGPFGRVRHPLYLAMAFLFIAPVVGLSSAFGSGIACPLFAAGTSLRIRAEEKLLAETFGADFKDYRRRVPAFFPRLRSNIARRRLS